MKLIMSKSRKLSKARLKLILGTLNLSMFKNWKNTYNWWRFLKQMNKDLSIRRQQKELALLQAQEETFLKMYRASLIMRSRCISCNIW